MNEASGPDVVRAHQKDEQFLLRFETEIVDLSNSWMGQQFTMRNQASLKLVGRLVYFHFSTLRGVQTLGEEYCDIRKVEVQNSTEISALTRLKLLWWAELFPHIYEGALSKLNIVTRPQYAGIPLQQSAFRTKMNQFCQRLLPLIKDTKDYASKVHLALFYFGGRYFEWSKRMSSIRYILDRPVGMPPLHYHILGVLIFLQLFVSSYSYLKSIVQFNKGSADTKEWVEETYPINRSLPSVPSPDCVLCLEPRKYPTIAECGHIFCWNCIHDSCQTKPECPLCRQSIQPQNLTRIYHYSS